MAGIAVIGSYCVGFSFFFLHGQFSIGELGWHNKLGSYACILGRACAGRPMLWLYCVQRLVFSYNFPLLASFERFVSKSIQVGSVVGIFKGVGVILNSF